MLIGEIVKFLGLFLFGRSRRSDQSVLKSRRKIGLITGPDRLCSATFEQLLAFGTTFCNFSNLEQLCIDMSNKNHKN